MNKLDELKEMLESLNEVEGVQVLTIPKRKKDQKRLYEDTVEELSAILLNLLTFKYLDYEKYIEEINKFKQTQSSEGAERTEKLTIDEEDYDYIRGFVIKNIVEVMDEKIDLMDALEYELSDISEN